MSNFYNKLARNVLHAVPFFLFIGLLDQLSADEVCLTHWEVSGRQHVSKFVGQEDAGYGAFCYRVDMITTTGVMGQFCLDVGISGDITYALQGSSYSTGKDCYSYGYVDAVLRWANACRLNKSENFRATINSVDANFCRE